MPKLIVFRLKLTVIILFALSILLLACNQRNSILVGASTTLEDSGLLPELIRRFESKHEVQIKPVIAGSGQLHDLIRRGNIDTAITHDPAGEARLLRDGIIQSKIFLMRNDFLIVGPTDDPAQVRSVISPVQALEKIHLTGALFVSRADNSGTHQAEQKWWKLAKIIPTPDNYLQTGTGMGATLAVAAERDGYTIVDRGSWLNFRDKRHLQIVFEDAKSLPNIYSILSFNKEKAEPWESWLQRDTTQKFIRNYRLNNEIVFRLEP
ncbi:MAG: tungstate transport system substrate-binding protein [Cellvibrionaceae bacterium]